MFSRTVTIDGRTIDVCCNPDTPLWEVLQRAANMLRYEGAKVVVDLARPEPLVTEARGKDEVA